MAMSYKVEAFPFKVRVGLLNPKESVWSAMEWYIRVFLKTS